MEVEEARRSRGDERLGGDGSRRVQGTWKDGRTTVEQENSERHNGEGGEAQHVEFSSAKTLAFETAPHPMATAAIH
eukprot:4607746-Pleurochrysis_carterae.AAC.1